MIDAAGRNVDHLRMSLTSKCNLDCFYCHKEGNHVTGEDISTSKAREILMEARKVGIKTVKFTGGEPMLRNDLAEIIGYAKALGFLDIGLTTNGTMLEDQAGQLKVAGLDRVNIGCDTNTDILPKNVPLLNQGIKAAKDARLGVKLNMVVLKDINDSEITEMFNYCKGVGVNLQLIELVPSTVDCKKYFFPLESIEKNMAKKADKITLREMQNRKRFYFEDLFVETVRPRKDFCKKCNKIRTMSDGRIRSCLIHDIIGDSFEKMIKARDTYGYG